MPDAIVAVSAVDWLGPPILLPNSALSVARLGGLKEAWLLRWLRAPEGLAWLGVECDRPVAGGEAWLPPLATDPAAEDLFGENRGEAPPAADGAWLVDSAMLGLRANLGDALLAEPALLGLRANLGDALLADSPTLDLFANLGDALLADSATLDLCANLGDALEAAAEERLLVTWDPLRIVRTVPWSDS